MDNQQPTAERRTIKPTPPAPPKMTKADWLRRDGTRVTLSRGELEHLGQLIVAGHALLRDGRPISPRLRAAFSRLGVAAHGL